MQQLVIRCLLEVNAGRKRHSVAVGGVLPVQLYRAVLSQHLNGECERNLIETRARIFCEHFLEAGLIVMEDQIDFAGPQFFVSEDLPRSRFEIRSNLFNDEAFNSVMNGHNCAFWRVLFVLEHGDADEQFKELGPVYVVWILAGNLRCIDCLQLCLHEGYQCVKLRLRQNRIHYITLLHEASEVLIVEIGEVRAVDDQRQECILEVIVVLQ